MSDSNNPAEYILQLAKQAKLAARELAAVSGEAKAAALAAMVEALQNSRGELARANAADLEDARKANKQDTHSLKTKSLRLSIHFL